MAWTSPRTWVAGEVVTASIGNTHWRDNFKAIGDAWTAYTPTWKSGAGGTDILIGNGTLSGVKREVGKTGDFQILLVRGSTTQLGTTGYAFGLPFISTTRRITGAAVVIDSDVAASIPHMWLGANSTEIVVHATGGNSGRRIDNNGFGTTPTAWQTSDELFLGGTVQIA